MISHIKLMGLMLNIIVGVALIAYIHQQSKRHADRILIQLKFYSAAVVTAILLFYLSTYLRLNIRPPLAARPILLPETLVYLIIYIIIITMSFLVISLSFLVTGKTVPTRLKKSGTALVVITLLGFAAHVLAPAASSFQAGGHFLMENFAIVFVLAELFFLGRTLIITLRSRAGEDQLAARNFALLFLSRYLVLLPVVFILPSLIRAFVFMMLFQGIVFAWLRWSYIPHRERLYLHRDARQIAAELTDRYALTLREREILQLMLLGKNNREIEDKLFISYNTVKNHIHAIYGKTGIANRFQLFRSLGRRATTMDEEELENTTAPPGSKTP